MNATPTKNTASALAEMREELAALEQRAAAAGDELHSIAFMAERGDPAAQQRRAELLGARSAAEHRARELRDAITSGEKHAEREAAEAAEAERASWATRADELRTAQLDAARRLDAALAAADAAWTDYQRAADARGAAMRRAGRPWSNVSWVSSFVARLMFKQAPALARLFGVNFEYRKAASTAEGMVAP